MNPLTIPELYSVIISFLHPYESLFSLYVCKDWNQWFRSIFKGDVEERVKESLLLYPLFPVSLRYHDSLNLFDRACQLGYTDSINYISCPHHEGRRKINWCIRFSCICFRYNNILALEHVCSSDLKSMINIVRKRTSLHDYQMVFVPMGQFHFDKFIKENYFDSIELAEFVIIFKTQYPMITNEVFSGLIGKVDNGIQYYYSIGEQLRKKIGVVTIRSLLDKYSLPQININDIPLLVTNNHKACNMNWMDN